MERITGRGSTLELFSTSFMTTLRDPQLISPYIHFWGAVSNRGVHSRQSCYDSTLLIYMLGDYSVWNIFIFLAVSVHLLDQYVLTPEKLVTHLTK